MFQVDILRSVEKVSISFLCVGSFAALIWMILGIAGAFWPSLRVNSKECAAVVFMFGFLAFVTGLVMAASRVGAVANVIPAALTLVGGVALYLFTKDRADRPLVFFAVVGFSAMLLFGTVLGSYERVRAVRHASFSEMDIDLLQHRANVEFLVNAYRKAHGLEPLPQPK